VVKANGEKYYIYAAIDVEKNELIYESLYNKELSDYQAFYNRSSKVLRE
jgi:transposase-like protein